MRRFIGGWNLEQWSRFVLTLGLALILVGMFTKTRFLYDVGSFLMFIVILFWIGVIAVCILYLVITTVWQFLQSRLGK